MRSSALTWCWWSRGDRWMRGRTVKRACSSRRSGCKTRTHTQFLARTSARAGLSPLATRASLSRLLGTRVPQNQKRAAFSRDSAARATRRRPGWQSRRPTAPTEWPGSSPYAAASSARTGPIVLNARRRPHLTRWRAPRPARRSARRAPPGSQSAAPTAGPQDGRRQARSTTRCPRPLSRLTAATRERCSRLRSPGRRASAAPPSSACGMRGVGWVMRAGGRGRATESERGESERGERGRRARARKSCSPGRARKCLGGV